MNQKEKELLLKKVIKIIRRKNPGITDEEIKFELSEEGKFKKCPNPKCDLLMFWDNNKWVCSCKNLEI